jgi:hypothetical protein
VGGKNMSHFFVGVLVPPGTDDIESKVDELMAPYDENLEVPEYGVTCWCIKNQAQELARQEIEREHGSVQSFRDRFEIYCEEQGLSWKEGDSEDVRWEKVARKDREWHTFAKPWTQDYEELRMEKRKEVQPRSDCEYCSGTGIYHVTYNPKSKWDWYSLGGRWNGVIRSTPRDDEEDGGFNFRDEFRQLPENVTTVEEFLTSPDGRIPYALVTPDGEWHQKGEMGWWGMDHCRVDGEQWEEAVKAMMENNKDCYVVGLDCHI